MDGYDDYADSPEAKQRQASAARGAAHRASSWSRDHRGIINHANAWAIRGKELMALSNEIDRRGLEWPSCDCELPCR